MQRLIPPFAILLLAVVLSTLDYTSAIAEQRNILILGGIIIAILWVLGLWLYGYYHMAQLRKSSLQHESILSEIKILYHLLSENIRHESQKQSPYAQESLKAHPEENPSSEHQPVNEGLSRERLLRIIKDAIKHERIEMLLQPVVSLPQRKLRFCEAFSRLRDAEGSIIIAEHYIEIAQQETVIHLIDHLLLFRCLQFIRQHLKKTPEIKFFCNFSVLTLQHHSFLQTIKEFIERNPLVAKALVCELNHSFLSELSDTHLKLIKNLALLGCQFSMDNLPSLDIHLKWLHEKHFKFIKIDIDVLLNILATEEGIQKIQRFKKEADSHGLDIILTRVESEKDLLNLLDFNFDFGQGYLFSPPRIIEKW